MPASARGPTLCHRLPPGFKLSLTLAAVLLSAFVPIRFWPLHAVLATLIFVAQTLAEIPLARLARRLLLFLPFAAGFSLAAPLADGFRSGGELAATIFIRATVAFLAALWLAEVLRFEELVATLQRLRVPAVFAAALAFMYRYVFVLWDELERMRTAWRARGFEGGGFRRRWGTAAQLVGMLLIRGLNRAERVHAAMLARGWDGQVRRLE